MIPFLRRLYDYTLFAAKMSFPIGKKAYLIGTPEHTNIGDSAIVVAEMAFLQENQTGRRVIQEITAPEYQNYRKLLRYLIPKRSTIYLHGGGNMGDVWKEEEDLRRQIIEQFPENEMVIFPQTIYYTATEQGTAEKEKSRRYYANSSKRTIVARERKSYEVMAELYPGTRILLTPDIVLSSTMELYGVKPAQRQGILLCFRGDKEKAMREEDRQKILDAAGQLGTSVQFTDMYSAHPVTKQNRTLCIREKMEEFASSRLVVTDRLHGMVFSALSGTPCIVLENSNHKVKGTYDWIRDLPYVRLAETAEEAAAWLPQLYAMQGCRFDNTGLLPHFAPLAEVVKGNA